MSSPTKPFVALVNDDESLCRSLGRVLRVSGIDSVSFHSAEELLADSDPSRFDCLRLDIQFEGISGMELITHRGHRFNSRLDPAGTPKRAGMVRIGGFVSRSRKCFRSEEQVPLLNGH